MYSFDTTTDIDYTPLLVTASDAMACKKILTTINKPGYNGILQRKLFEISQQSTKISKPTATGLICARPVNNITEVRLRKRKCRLIIRNLSFQATEMNILTKLMSFGPITEVLLPRISVECKRVRPGKSTEDNTEKLKSRGFAFVTYVCESDAKDAVENASNVKICNREFAIDFCSAKDRQMDTTTGSDPNETETEAAIHSSEGSNSSENGATNSEDEEKIEKSSLSDHNDDESESESDDNSLDHVEEDSITGSGSDSDGEEEHQENLKVAEKPADVSEGKTIFVRYDYFMYM